MRPLILLALPALTLAACGGSNANNTSNEAPAATEQANTSSEETYTQGADMSANSVDRGGSTGNTMDGAVDSGNVTGTMSGNSSQP